MKNQLLEKIEYQIEETPRGTWRRFVYPTGQYFAEFRSNTTVFGLPLIHFTRGKCPETGRRIVAKGIIAVGRFAVGVIAIGQASAGLISLGQASLGMLFCLGQASAGLISIGQLAIGVHFGAGQIATGATAIGQMAYGKFVLAQLGAGKHLWTQEQLDPAAVQYFNELWNSLTSLLG